MNRFSDLRAIFMSHLKRDSHLGVVVDMKDKNQISRLEWKRAPTTRGLD